MKKYILIFLLLLSGCARVATTDGIKLGQAPILEQPRFTELRDLKPAFHKPVVAVYDFPDLTGQRKDKDRMFRHFACAHAAVFSATGCGAC
jgi:hypothetical protein